MKGIILAAGQGTRLYPTTKSVNKQLLPIYDKPMIYYPLAVLMEIGIQDIILITSEREQINFKNLLGDGTQFGVRLEYGIQKEAKGISDAFICAEDFVKDDEAVLILGDNLFYGLTLKENLENAVSNLKAGYSTVFGYKVDNPEIFGVIEFDEDYNVLSLEEKPTHPKSNYAATGLYFYTPRAIQYAKTLEPGPRGEIEITDLNKIYLNNSALRCELLGDEITWFDAGTYEGLIDASYKVKNYEQKTDIKVAMLEEIALRKQFITRNELTKIVEKMTNSGYKDRLKELI